MQGTLHFEEVLPDVFYDDPEFAEFHILRIPKRLANDFSKLLDGDRFAGRFPHLKRMRRVLRSGEGEEKGFLGSQGDDLGVEVLIGESRSDLSPEADSFLDKSGVPKVWSVLGLPKSPPLTRERYLELSKLWSLSYLKPRWTPEKLSPESQATANRMIRYAIRVGEIARNKGSPERGCIITLGGKVVAVGEDSRNSDYPWMHSAMMAINNFSQRVWNSGTDQKSEPIHKSGFGDISMFGEEELLPDSELKDQYLCTGAVAYLSHEPCISCSMALVHSRVSKVFYMYRDTDRGFLGSKCKLHCISQLNHHYRVYAASGE